MDLTQLKGEPSRLLQQCGKLVTTKIIQLRTSLFFEEHSDKSLAAREPTKTLRFLLYVA